MSTPTERRLRAKALRFVKLIHHAARLGLTGREAQLRRALRRTRNALTKERRKQYIAGSHFTWTEAVRNSGYASRAAMPADVQRGVVRAAKRLDVLRLRINRERKKRHYLPTTLTVISWVRSPAHNTEVHGAPKSQHLKGTAVDIALQEVRRLCPWGGFDAIASDVYKHDGFGQYPGGNRHVDVRGFWARWTTWTRT